MARAYLIGGAPRVGKSTLAAMIAQELPVTAESTDSLRASLRRPASPSSHPDLFYLDSLNSNESEMARLMREETGSIIAATDRESAAVWPAVEDFIRQQLAMGADVVVEGVAILPKFIASLHLDHSAVFLGNQSPAHAAIIQHYAARHPDSWLGGLQPATLEAFAAYCTATSAHIEHEAHKYHLPYIEMGGPEFTEVLGAARRQLLT